MGAYSPTPVVTQVINDHVMKVVIIPTVEGMAAEGKLFGGFITIMGICVYALPAGILSSSYTGKMQLKRDRFKDTVRTALDDGVLSEHDAHHIERVRGLLDVDEEEAHLIIRLLQHHHNSKSKDK